MINKGTKEKPRWDYVDWPCKCELCDERIKERHGCGYDEKIRGKGIVQLASTGETLTHCPQWLCRQPFIYSVLELLNDYKDARLPNVMELPAVLFDMLRIANNESNEWQRIQQDKMYE